MRSLYKKSRRTMPHDGFLAYPLALALTTSPAAPNRDGTDEFLNRADESTLSVRASRQANSGSSEDGLQQSECSARLGDGSPERPGCHAILAS